MSQENLEIVQAMYAGGLGGRQILGTSACTCSYPRRRVLPLVHWERGGAVGSLGARGRGVEAMVKAGMEMASDTSTDCTSEARALH